MGRIEDELISENQEAKEDPRDWRRVRLYPQQAVRVGDDEMGIRVRSLTDGGINVVRLKDGKQVDAQRMELVPHEELAVELIDGVVVKVLGLEVSKRRTFFLDFPEGMAVVKLLQPVGTRSGSSSS